MVGAIARRLSTAAFLPVFLCMYLSDGHPGINVWTIISNGNAESRNRQPDRARWNIRSTSMSKLSLLELKTEANGLQGLGVRLILLPLAWIRGIKALQPRLDLGNMIVPYLVQ